MQGKLFADAVSYSSCFHHPQVSPGEYTPVPDLLSAIPVFLFLCQMTSVDGLHPDSSPSLLKLSLLAFYHPASSFCPLVSLLNTSPCGCLGVPWNSCNLTWYPIFAKAMLSCCLKFVFLSLFLLTSVLLPNSATCLGCPLLHSHRQFFGPAVHHFVWITTEAPDWCPYLPLL